MIDTWINLWECVIPKHPFEMPFGAYKHVNIKQTHTHKYIYIYISFPIPTYFVLAFVSSTSSSHFLVSKACGNHQVRIQAIHRPFLSRLMHCTWLRRTCQVILHHACCNVRTIWSIWLPYNTQSVSPDVIEACIVSQFMRHELMQLRRPIDAANATWVVRITFLRCRVNSLEKNRYMTTLGPSSTHVIDVCHWRF
jgi:hypothetical protein